MHRSFDRSMALLLAAIVAVPLAIAPLAQTAPAASHDSSASAAKASRDLATVPPESVGISPERLQRIDLNMKRLVDDGQVAGLVTLLERHGKVAYTGVVGKPDVGKAGALRATLSSASTR
jgi:hypothetical protein